MANIPNNIPYIPLPPLFTLTPELKESSEKQAKATLFQILSKLLGTIFFREAPALATLRDALGDAFTPLLPDGLENYKLLCKFFSCVPSTSYEDYQPFVSRLLDNKFPRLSDVNDLLSPGLPAYIVHNSGTSGGRFKHLPKYPDSSDIGRRWDDPDVPGFKLCRITILNLSRWRQVVDDDNNIIQDIPVAISPTVTMRFRLGIGPRDDPKIIDKKGLKVNFLVEIDMKVKVLLHS